MTIDEYADELEQEAWRRHHNGDAAVAQFAFKVARRLRDMSELAEEVEA